MSGKTAAEAAAVEAVAGRPRRTMLVASTGGHLAQLVALRSAFEGDVRSWITFNKPDAHAALKGETVAWAHHPTTRNIPNTLRNLRLAARAVRSFKPDVIVSTGAGVAVPFFLVAKALGATTVYIEVYDRIDSPTLTGRLVRKITDVFCVQWPEQLEIYPGAHVIGPAL